MSKTRIPFTLIILCLVASFLGGLWAASAMGIIDLTGMLGQLPVVGGYFVKPEQAQPKVPAVSPIEEENIQLRVAKVELEKKILDLEKEKATLLSQVEEIQQELAALREYKEQKERARLKAEEMAMYYKEMKPEAAVKVMNNLDDSTVVAILPLLEKEQAAKILSLMEPQRAAFITQLLLENNPPGM
ncbi:MAG: hypothetical protein QHH10_01835 [Peptococcaceae bacterium]|jgi:flagellar motility protein MotE (MotC chaperone)|nr:hypothetical protein [Peptococcaceae bacterium]MDH7524037.1 hypothetical protein [Peptococcaceae bacterium]